MVTPTITSIKDSKGVEIPHGGTTIYTSVTITGTASKGQKVELLDDNIYIDKAAADPWTGAWTLTVKDLASAAHNFTAKALYGYGSSSPIRNLLVERGVIETFESITPLGMHKNIELQHLSIQAGQIWVDLANPTSAPYLSGVIIAIEGATNRWTPKNLPAQPYGLSFGAFFYKAANQLTKARLDITFDSGMESFYLDIKHHECKQIVFRTQNKRRFLHFGLNVGHDSIMDIDNLILLY